MKVASKPHTDSPKPSYENFAGTTIHATLLSEYMKLMMDKMMPSLATSAAHSLKPIMERLNEIMTPQRMEAFSESVIRSLSAWVEANKNLLENVHKLEPLLNKVNPSEILDDVEILEKIDSCPW